MSVVSVNKAPRLHHGWIVAGALCFAASFRVLPIGSASRKNRRPALATA